MALIQDTIHICIFQLPFGLHFKGKLMFFGIKLFNHLPINIKNLPNETKLFKHASKIFLLLHSFYSIDEYFNYNNIQNLGLTIIQITGTVIFIYYSYSCTILSQLIYCTNNTNASLTSTYRYTDMIFFINFIKCFMYINLQNSFNVLMFTLTELNTQKINKN